MIDSKLFSNTCVIKNLKFKINDYELSQEDVIQVEIAWNMYKFGVEGSLLFKDSFDVSSLNVFEGSTKVSIYGVDLYEQIFSRTFIITKVNNAGYNERFKAVSFSFVDELYFKLSTTYISKSFSGKISSTFNDFWNYLSFDSLTAPYGVTKNIATTTESYSMVVPQDRNVLTFFETEFYKQGYRFYQDRYNVTLDNTKINKLKYLDNANIVYTNNVKDNEHPFLIKDYQITFNDVVSINENYPTIECLKYDISSKSFNKTSLNYSDVYDDLKLNDMSVTLQHSTGKKLITQERLSTKEMYMNIERTFIKNVELVVVLPGNFKYNKLGRIVEVQLKGNPMIKQSSDEGDVFNSGKYVITAITDKFIGDKMLQKVTLNRVDFKKVRV